MCPVVRGTIGRRDARKKRHARRYTRHKRSMSYARACSQQCNFWVLSERITMVSDARTSLIVSGWDTPSTETDFSMHGYHFPSSATPTVRVTSPPSNYRHLVAVNPGLTLVTLKLRYLASLFLFFFNSPKWI